MTDCREPEKLPEPEQLIVVKVGAWMHTSGFLDFDVDVVPSYDDLNTYNAIKDFLHNKFPDRSEIDPCYTVAERLINDYEDAARANKGPLPAKAVNEGSVFSISVTKPSYLVYTTAFSNWYFRKGEHPVTGDLMPPMTPKVGTLNLEYFEPVEIIAAVNTDVGGIVDNMIYDYGILVKKPPVPGKPDNSFKFDIHMSVFQGDYDDDGNWVEKITKLIIDPKIRNP